MREIKSREKGERGRWHLNEYLRGRKTSKERVKNKRYKLKGREKR